MSSLALDRGREQITRPPYRLDKSGVLRIGFDFLPQAPDLNIDGAVKRSGRAAACEIEQFIPA